MTRPLLRHRDKGYAPPTPFMLAMREFAITHGLDRVEVQAAVLGEQTLYLRGLGWTYLSAGVPTNWGNATVLANDDIPEP